MKRNRSLEFITDEECVVDGIHYISAQLRVPQHVSQHACDGCAFASADGPDCQDIGSVQTMRCCCKDRNDRRDIVWKRKPTETVVQPEGEKVMSEKPEVAPTANPLPLPPGSQVVHLCLSRRTVTRKAGVVSDITRTGYATLVAVPDRAIHGYRVGASFCEPEDSFSKPEGIQRALERIEDTRQGIPTAYTFFLSHHALTGQREWHDIALSILVLDLLNAPEWCIRALKSRAMQVKGISGRQVQKAVNEVLHGINRAIGGK